MIAIRNLNSILPLIHYEKDERPYREDGPAIINYDGTLSFYLDGELCGYILNTGLIRVHSNTPWAISESGKKESKSV